MAKELRCNDIVEGCDYVARAETMDELMAQGAEHAKEVHGITEMDDEMMEKVMAAVRDVPE